jgi:hypothetical protein
MAKVKRGLHNKRLHVSEDTQIHMSTVYTRNGVGHKENALRSFSFVIKGLLISSIFVGALVMGGAPTFASSNDATQVPSTAYTQQDNQNQFKDETAMISNLKMSVKVLNAAIQRGELSSDIYDNVMKKLTSIDVKLTMDGQFNSQDALAPVLRDTDIALKAPVDGNTAVDILARRAKSIDMLTRVQDILGVPTAQRGDDKLMDQGIVITTESAKKNSGHEVKIASMASEYPTVNVTIDGVLQNFEQSAVLKDGNTLVPLRGIFEKLGAEVKWDQDTQTVTATKGGTAIKLTIGQQSAFVNGKAVSLVAKAEILNGSTMVPLRFVSEALGADVQWDNVNTMAIITSAGGTAPVVQAPQTSGQVVHGIKVQYGKHNYGTSNQAQYDQVMKIVNDAVSDVANVPIPDEVTKYANGDRASNYAKETYEHRSLTVAEQNLRDLVSKGATKADLIKVYQANYIAVTLLHGATDPGTGAPSSAYDALITRVSDCDSDSQVYSAVFDAMGVSSVVLASGNHADPFVQIAGSWFKVGGGSFKEANLSKIPSSYTIKSQPTFGPELSR